MVENIIDLLERTFYCSVQPRRSVASLVGKLAVAWIPLWSLRLAKRFSGPRKASARPSTIGRSRKLFRKDTELSGEDVAIIVK